MSLRETLNNNPAVVTGAAVVLLLVAVIILGKVLFFSGGGGAVGNEQVIYYDVANKTIKLIERSTKDPYPDSPLDGSPDTYQASIFSCGECGEITDGMTLDDLKAAGMFVGYLHQRDPGTENDPEFNPTYKIRLFEGKKWISAGDGRLYQVEEQIHRKCPGGQFANYCFAAFK
ncbi:MAG: hypothetical protein ACE37H_11120 [Phycisphaeraceae bacterium]